MTDQGHRTEQSATHSNMRRRVTYTTKLLGITMLGVMAVSGPAVAFYDDSPILIPFLQLIQKALKDALGDTIKNGFNSFVKNQIDTQVQQYTKEVTANMMPGAFSEADIVKPVLAGEIARVAGLDEAKGFFDVTGADSIINVQKAVNQLPVSPNTVIAHHNAEVRNYAMNARCKPVQAAPADVSGTNISCTQEERRLNAAVLLGATPPPTLPNRNAAGALGEVYESASTTMAARKQLAALALNDVSSTTKQDMLSSYRAALAKPSIEELQRLSSDGGVSRDEAVLKQISARILFENYVEQLENKRLLAVYVAQRAEIDERKLLAPIRRANAK